MSTYVITGWRASRDRDADGNYVLIRGRRQGVIAWLLSRLGIDPTLTLQVRSRHIEFSRAQLTVNERRLIPLRSVSATTFRFTTPWKSALLLGVLAALVAGALVGPLGGPQLGIAVGALVGVVIAVLHVVLNRAVMLGFVEHSGAKAMLEFKRSIIEGQEIDERSAQHVCDLVQMIIDARDRAAA